MNSYVLDASALLRFIEDQPGASRIEELLNLAQRAEIRILLSAVNWGEIYYVIVRLRGEAQASFYSARFRNLPIEIVAADWRRAESAGRFLERFKVPYADSFAGSLAADESATLVTADYDFKAVEDTVGVEFLPMKRKRSSR